MLSNESEVFDRSRFSTTLLFQFVSRRFALRSAKDSKSEPYTSHGRDLPNGALFEDDLSDTGHLDLPDAEPNFGKQYEEGLRTGQQVQFR